MIRWILLLQEFDLELKDKKGSTNIVADHLSRIIVQNFEPLTESFPDEQILAISQTHHPWFAHIVNYKVAGRIPLDWTQHERNKFFAKEKHYVWEDPELFKIYPDNIIRRCVLEFE